MASLNVQRIVPLDTWLAESLRATIFPGPGVTPVADSWWREVTNSDPDSRTIKPATREHLEEGPFEAARLVLSVNAIGAIQWQVGAPRPTEIPADIISAGSAAELLPAFVGLLERWFPMCPVASRIAFGVIGLLPASEQRESYEKLGALVRSVKIDPVTSSDFLYRINRPRASTTSIANLRINRLSTWHAIKMGVMALPMGGGRGKVVNEKYACRVEVDINTAPDFQGTFTSQQVAEVFHELRDSAVEILEMGDVE